MRQEALLAGTEALPWGTVAIAEYRGKWLVRFKSCDRQTVTQTKFEKLELSLAMDHFWQCAERLKRESRTF
jgi:hypothetical protein